MKYSVNIESLHRNFPPDCEVPLLLLEFANWLKVKSWGSLGCFSLHSERFNDYWIENGADLHSNFAFFIRDPTGGNIGYWLYEGQTIESAPIVLVGSEGELKILADSLDEFLRRLAAGTTEAPDLDSRENGDAESAELTTWLEMRTGKSSAHRQCVHPDLQQWMDGWGERQREWIDNDAPHQEIANRLRKFVKPNAKEWETEAFDVLLVGSQFKIWHRSYGLKPIPQEDVSELERLFRLVREYRAASNSDRGLWFSSFVRIGSDGGAVLCCNFMDQPVFLDQKPIIPAADYEQDLRAFPRSQHWMPEWLN
jgi:hypothetical protein